ncbi:lysozyme [Streptomyces sp. SID625]|nr:lysozyme [Streptomyces sp. SID625]
MNFAKWAASASALALVTAGSVLALAPSGEAATADVYSVAPYVDMSNSQEGMLDTAITGHHLKAYTAAFVLGSGCNQIWGDTLPVGNDSFTDPLIAKAKSEGASLIISSGGASGLPLAWTCSTPSSIQAGYQKLIDTYGVTQLDFDVEGAAVADTAAAARHMQAMKALKAANPSLSFSMTLPVLASGLTNDGVNILKAAKSAGVKIDVVNIMTMDYYSGTGTEMGQGSIAAAQATLAQMQSVDPSYTYGNLGITPMIGKNDDGSTFTLADATAVEKFAEQHGVGRLSFWSINRDQPCSGSANSLSTCSQISQSSLAFTDAFMAYAGGSGSSGGTTSGGTTSGGTTSGGTASGGTTSGGTTTGGTTDGGTTSGGTTSGGSGGGSACTVTAWDSSQVYTGGTSVSWKGHDWKAKWWTQGEEPGTTGEWGVWQDLGSC